MNLIDLLSSAEKGNLSACRECPWNPKRIEKLTHGNKKSSFGTSCEKHGLEYSLNQSAISLLIAQDPAGTTPEKTGNLCTVCNSANPSDNTAKHGFDFWQYAVALADSGPNTRKYLKQHYWTNAIMHGFKAKKDASEIEKLIEKQHEAARICCTEILLEQITILSPRIIIAIGKYAADSLFETKLISRNWDQFKYGFSTGPYTEQITLPSGKEAAIYCTYHFSSKGLTHATPLYSDKTIEMIYLRMERLPDKSPAQKFLRKYQDIEKEDKGMRVLFLHWLEIGEAIRLANG